MASRNSRGRGARPPNVKAAAATVVEDPPDVETPPQTSSNGKLPSHLTHHRMIARNLNGLLENFGELRNQVVEVERDYKRVDKDLDARLFQVRNQVEAIEAKLSDFMEEMTTVAFEANLKLRGHTDELAALWEAVKANVSSAQDVEDRRLEAAAREEARQAEVDRRLQDLVTQQQEQAAKRRNARMASPRK